MKNNRNLEYIAPPDLSNINTGSWNAVFLLLRLQQGLQDKGYEEWVGEMIGMREILKHFANISRNDVVGMRAPFLKPGRNAQYAVS